VFSRFFIDRPIFAAVLSIVITLGGLISVIHLPLAQFSTHHAADRIRDGHVPRREREGRGRGGGGPHRAVHQRRRRDDVHVVPVHQRRLLQPDGHLSSGDRPEHGPGAGAEPRQPGDPESAGRDQGGRRDDAQALARHPHGHCPQFAQGALQAAIPEQLRAAANQGRAVARRGGGRCLPVWPARLQYAGMAKPGQAVVPELDSRRRRPGHPGSKCPVRQRHDRATVRRPCIRGAWEQRRHAGNANAFRRARPAPRSGPVREHHRQMHAWRPNGPAQGRCPRRAGGQEPGCGCHAGRHADGVPGDFSIA